MASKHDEVLEVLMRYPQKWWRKTVPPLHQYLSHAMSNGEPLMSWYVNSSLPLFVPCLRS